MYLNNSFLVFVVVCLLVEICYYFCHALRHRLNAMDFDRSVTIQEQTCHMTLQQFVLAIGIFPISTKYAPYFLNNKPAAQAAGADRS